MMCLWMFCTCRHLMYIIILGGFCLDNYRFGISKWTHNILLHGCITVIGFGMDLFPHPDCLVVQCWAHTAYLSPDTIKQMGTQTYRYVKFFEGWVSYACLSALCNHIMAIIYQTYAVLPSVVIVYSVLWTAPTSHMPFSCKLSGFNPASMNSPHVHYASWVDDAMSVHLSVYACLICSFHLFVCYCIMSSWCSWVFCLIYYHFVHMLINISHAEYVQQTQYMR